MFLGTARYASGWKQDILIPYVYLFTHYIDFAMTEKQGDVSPDCDIYHVEHSITQSHSRRPVSCQGETFLMCSQSCEWWQAYNRSCVCHGQQVQYRMAVYSAHCVHVTPKSRTITMGLVETRIWGIFHDYLDCNLFKFLIKVSSCLICNMLQTVRNLKNRYTIVVKLKKVLSRKFSQTGQGKSRGLDRPMQFTP